MKIKREGRFSEGGIKIMMLYSFNDWYEFWRRVGGF